MDAPLVLFAIGASLLCALLCGLLPAACFVRSHPQQALRAEGRTASESTGGSGCAACWSSERSPPVSPWLSSPACSCSASIACYASIVASPPSTSSAPPSTSPAPIRHAANARSVLQKLSGPFPSDTRGLLRRCHQRAPARGRPMGRHHIHTYRHTPDVVAPRCQLPLDQSRLLRDHADSAARRPLSTTMTSVKTSLSSRNAQRVSHGTTRIPSASSSVAGSR